MHFLKLVCRIPFLKKQVSKIYTPADAPVKIFGLQFKNPVGLAAGFDKNAKYLDELEALGFGFVEIGTVTPLPQSGNNKPRLFRLPKDRALVNRMGFNNDGAQVVAGRLKEWRKKQLASGDMHSNPQPATHNPQLIIGGNIGKNKITPNEDAWKDYETCFLVLFEWVDYFVVNVSSPNTPGLRELQQKDALQKILSHLQKLNSRQKNTKPILLKISPDVSTDELNDIIQLAMDINLDGLIVANTTTGRDQLQTSNSRLQQAGAGGLSGRPLKERSTQLVDYISQRTGKSIPVIASGGIFNGMDAKEKINAGATLVQVWTGFIYEGPGIVRNICRSLAYLHP